MNDLKDGDYFSYSWKVGLGPSTDPYWCRDRRCVARADQYGDIVLIDTWNYWPFKGHEEDTNIFTYDGLNQEYSKYVNLASFDLDFICNLNDYEFVSGYSKDDYEGVIFVGYQCTKKWAKPKGAQVSNKALRTKYQGLLDKAHSDKCCAEYNIEYYSKLIEELGE